MVISIIAVLLAFVVGFFVAIKAVQLGLRWQVQIAHKQEPSINSPIPPKQTKDASTYTKAQIDEWLNGEGK